mmetsp:Transcript_55187/g.109580  ORF Transcript_55187/g.109580 Transcript_55187/m.109580 type:complete len:229 (-) Transcript_55187:277-963(-)
MELLAIDFARQLVVRSAVLCWDLDSALELPLLVHLDLPSRKVGASVTRALKLIERNDGGAIHQPALVFICAEERTEHVAVQDERKAGTAEGGASALERPQVTLGASKRHTEPPLLRVNHHLDSLIKPLLHNLEQLQTRLSSRNTSAPLKPTDPIKESIVLTSLCEMIKTSKALLDVPNVMRKELLETEERVLIAISVNVDRGMLGGGAELLGENWLAAVQMNKKLPGA